MKFTYANVMSTIAMFAAVTTGTSYAAASLGKDSVRTREIKNGQVTLADLHPTVRKKLGSAATGGGGTTARPPAGRPGAWADARVTATGPWTACTASCGAGTMGGYHAGPHVEATALNLGTARTANFRWVGSVTNTGSKVAYFTVAGYRGKTTSLPASKGANFTCTTPFAGIAPGQTLTAADLGCMNNPDAMKGVPADQTRYVRTRVDLLADDNGFPSGLTSTLRLDVQPVA